jgi:hypothetical protein
MTKLDQGQLTQIVAAVIAALGNNTGTSAASSAKPPLNDLAAKDAAIVRAFTKRGFKDVQLMDRSDKSKPYNIKPFKAWLAEGRIVRRGQRGFHGLFHRDQTDLLPVKAVAKPTITTEQKELFAKAKAVFKAKKAKAQPTAAH